MSEAAGRHPLPIALTDDNGDVTYTQPLSWRDVGRMVAESEARITNTLNELNLRVVKVLDKHEERIGSLEDYQIGEKATAKTAEAFFRFGRWVLATIISISGVAAAFLLLNHH